MVRKSSEGEDANFSDHSGNGSQGGGASGRRCSHYFRRTAIHGIPTEQGRRNECPVCPSLRTIYMIIDTLKIPQLKDRRVRQALNFGWTRRQLLKES